MAIHRSEDWSNAHVAANDFLAELLTTLRSHNYDPSSLISYDRKNNHVVLDSSVLKKHDDVEDLYSQYLDACSIRDNAVGRIQNLEKLDIGFE